MRAYWEYTRWGGMAGGKNAGADAGMASQRLAPQSFGCGPACPHPFASAICRPTARAIILNWFISS